MITALDTNVLLDVLLPDPRFADDSQIALDKALADGGLVIGEIVYAELASQFLSTEALDAFLAETHIRLTPSGRRSLGLAAAAWKRYSSGRGSLMQCPACGREQAVACQDCGRAMAPRRHILSDFMVGGHAIVEATCLLTRDRGYYGRYFPDLRVVGP